MYHQLTVIGNVGKDPELRYTQSGVAVVNFSLAVTEKFGSGDDRKETTTWYKIVGWKAIAETINQYVSKGSKVFITGTPSLEVYSDKQGEAKGTLVLTVQTIKFLGGGKERSSDDEDYSPPGGGIPF